jgi:hypothetical protein
VEQRGHTVPGGCRVTVAEDLLFLKKTTTGKSKVDVVDVDTLLLSLHGRPPPKMYVVDVGPKTRKNVASLVESSDVTVCVGSVTHTFDHQEATKCAPLVFSAPASQDEVNVPASLAWIAAASSRAGSMCFVVGDHWAQAAARHFGIGGLAQPVEYFPQKIALHPPEHSAQDSVSLPTRGGTPFSAAQPLPRGSPKGSGFVLLNKIFAESATASQEAVHVSTLPYAELVRIIGGEAWPALRDLPCPVVARRYD